MMLRRVIGLVAVTFVGILFILGSAAKQPSQQKAEMAYVPRFDYQPPSQAAPGSAAVAFAVVNPQFSAKAMTAWGGTTPKALSDFQSAMGADFQEILAAKGFTARGPFGSYQEITFPDKKGTDLVLVADIDVTIDDLGRKADWHASLFGPNTFTFSGAVQLGGRINLHLAESLSDEKMWTKSVALPAKQVAWTGTASYQNPTNPNATTIGLPPFHQHFSDPGFTRAIGPELESYYATVMNAAWNYLNPEEMALVKRQSAEIRQKKVY
jgi:hypothetical protein